MLTGEEIRAARALLGWSRAELSFRARLPLAVIAALEDDGGAFGMFPDRVAFIVLTFEDAGVEFSSGAPRVRPREGGRMISEALRAAAAHVDDNASAAVWDPHHRLTDEQRFAKGENIRAVARELRALADAAETRGLRYGEYEALKDRLYAFGAPLPPALAQGVAAAFHAAAGPAKPRGKDWLKLP